MISNKSELIDEYGNYFFISLINAVNSIVDGEKFIPYSFRKKARSDAGDSEGDYLGEISDEIKSEYGVLFKLGGDNFLTSRIDSRIPMCLSKTERIYLKSILHSKYSKLFLSDDEIAQLDSSLYYVPYIPIDEYVVSSPSNPSSFFAKQADKLRLLLLAIKESREISYSNKTRNTHYKNKRGYPIKIEYSVLYDVLQLSLWSSDDNRPVKLNVRSMYNISLTENVWKEKKSPAEMLGTKRCKEPIIVVISDDINTLERANILFSMYDTKTVKNNGKYQLEIGYYEYEKFEIINNLISLGPYVKVISPPEIVDSIREHIIKLSEEQLKQDEPLQIMQRFD